MLRKILPALLLVAVMTAAGCANMIVGREISKPEVGRILPGVTKREQIPEWFGAPLHQTAGPDGDIFVYRYLDGRGRCEELCVGFREDIVSVYSSQF